MTGREEGYKYANTKHRWNGVQRLGQTGSMDGLEAFYGSQNV